MPVHHNRPPPPPPDDSCDVQYLAAELESAELLQEKPAATAVPLSDTGGTGGPCSSGKKSAEAKSIHNKFVQQRKYLDNHPELKQHLDDLVNHHPQGSPVIREYKKAIGECKKGQFDTPFLIAIKKRIKIKQWGKETELGSWKQVVDRHGPAVAFAALRQGTLPYVPHSLLLPGHGLKFPESHEFLMARRFWGETWKTEIEYPDDDPIETQHGIDEFLRKENSNTLEMTVARASRGLPEGVTLPAPPPQQDPAATVAPTLPAATAHPAATVPIKQEGVPAHCGVKYDEAHGSASKNITKVVGQWPGLQKRHELTVLKVQDHPMVKGGMPLQEVQRMLVMCSKKFDQIEKVHLEMQLKGRGFHSMEQLENTQKSCEDIWKLDKSIMSYMKQLNTNAALPIVPDVGA